MPISDCRSDLFGNSRGNIILTEIELQAHWLAVLLQVYLWAYFSTNVSVERYNKQIGGENNQSECDESFIFQR